jgi:hypothetical protein
MPRLALALLLALHGALHLLGFMKGMALADPGALERPISRVGAALWLTAGVLFLAAAVMLYAAPAHWWIPAVPALCLSQGLVFGAWSDARFGTLANIADELLLGRDEDRLRAAAERVGATRAER